MNRIKIISLAAATLLFCNTGYSQLKRVELGNGVSFTAKKNENFRYHWVLLDAEGNPKEINDTALYKGIDSIRLRIPSVTAAMDSQRFRCNLSYIIKADTP